MSTSEISFPNYDFVSFRLSGDQQGYDLFINFYFGDRFVSSASAINLHILDWRPQGTWPSTNYQILASTSKELFATSSSIGDGEYFSNTLVNSDEEVLYLFEEEIGMLFLENGKRPLPHQGGLKKRVFPDLIFDFPIIPALEFSEQKQELIIQIHGKATSIEKTTEFIIRISSVQRLVLNFLTTYDEVPVDFWFEPLDDENEKEGSFFLYKFPIVIQNSDTGIHTTFIEIIGGKAEMIEHNLWQ